MESTESDQFFLALQKRHRNLTKKLEKIEKKAKETKASKKELLKEEKEMIESRPHVEASLEETGRLIEQYKQHASATKVKKPQPKTEENKSSEVVNLWVLGEFLKHPEIKDRFKQENPSEGDLEPFLNFHSQSAGEPNETLAQILSNMQKATELYLSKSDKVAPGTLRTYKNLNEFAARAFNWCKTQERPATPSKQELTLETGPAYSTIQENWPAPPTEVRTSKWAEMSDEEEEEEPIVSKEPQPEEEGFVEVKTRKSKAPKRPPVERPRRRGRRPRA